MGTIGHLLLKDLLDKTLPVFRASASLEQRDVKCAASREGVAPILYFLVQGASHHFFPPLPSKSTYTHTLCHFVIGYQLIHNGCHACSTVTSSCFSPICTKYRLMIRLSNLLYAEVSGEHNLRLGRKRYSSS